MNEEQQERMTRTGATSRQTHVLSQPIWTSINPFITNQLNTILE